MRVVALCVVAAVFGTSLATWSVYDKDSQTYCILLDANISGVVSYYDDVVNATQQYKFVVNSSVATHGKCNFSHGGEAAEEIKLEFLPNDITPTHPVQERWELTVVFAEKNDKHEQGAFGIKDFWLRAHFYEGSFNSSEQTINYTKSKDAELEWSGENNNGFSCSTAGLSLTNDSSLQFKNLKVLAFAQLESAEFPTNQTFEQCKLDVRTSDIVPIVVGACLAGLVVIVLIAYLIGRARARRQGYASV